MGGGFGSHFGQISRYDFGLVQNIHEDLSYHSAKNLEGLLPVGSTRHSASLEDNWQVIVDKIYRGSLLSHFYLEREMTNLQIDGENVHMEFGKKEVIADVTREHVKVTWGDVVVADDDDRFIPRDNAIYVYSLAGTDREWVLPKKFRGKKLKVFTLTKDGRGTAPDYELKKTSIKIKLQPGVPVKIMPGK